MNEITFLRYCKTGREEEETNVSLSKKVKFKNVYISLFIITLHKKKSLIENWIFYVVLIET